VEVNEWFESSIQNKEISYYNYEEFDNISKIGFGASATVYIANLKKVPNSETANNLSSSPIAQFAIKKFHEISSTMNEVVNEVSFICLKLFYFKFYY
jgi:hypothetical protein